MKINVKKILSNHRSEIKAINIDQPIPKLAKSIDSITQKTLREIYNLADIRRIPVKMNKKGHCC